MSNIYWALRPSRYSCTGCRLHNSHVNRTLSDYILIGSPLRVKSVPGPVKSIRIPHMGPGGLLCP